MTGERFRLSRLFLRLSNVLHRAEDVGIVPIVVAELKLSDVQRQILTADFVEAAHNAALQERPETVDGLGVDRAVYILSSAMPDNAVLFQLAITRVIVGCGLLWQRASHFASRRSGISSPHERSLPRTSMGFWREVRWR